MLAKRSTISSLVIMHAPGLLRAPGTAPSSRYFTASAQRPCWRGGAVVIIGPGTTRQILTVRYRTMLELEVKQLIIDVLQLEDMRAEDIDSAAPLFGDGLGLDSIDALELSVALQQRYGVVLPADAAGIRRHLATVQALTALIAASSAPR
ncbi:MAG: phosphopantetheine-binding protein [Duganella sp.]